MISGNHQPLAGRIRERILLYMANHSGPAVANDERTARRMLPPDSAGTWASGMVEVSEREPPLGGTDQLRRHGGAQKGPWGRVSIYLTVQSVGTLNDPRRGPIPAHSSDASQPWSTHHLGVQVRPQQWIVRGGGVGDLRRAVTSVGVRTHGNDTPAKPPPRNAARYASLHCSMISGRWCLQRDVLIGRGESAAWYIGELWAYGAHQ